MQLFETNYATITPAYGRDYKSKRAFLEDFDANKDFTLQHMGRSTYINKEQIRKGTVLTARYGNLRKSATITVK